MNHRCQQHNAGTASKYTRSRLPVELVYQQRRKSGYQGAVPEREAGADPTEDEATMIPPYEDPHFSFRFAEDRLIPRFRLEGVEAGRKVSVFKIDPKTGERLGLLATAIVGDGGWVDLAEPIIVRAGEAFIAVTDPPGTF